MQASDQALHTLLNELKECRVCESYLPYSPRPVIRVSLMPRLLIISQAPSPRVHETGLPFNDPSGDRLRAWLGVNRDTFYDVSKIAFMPMGLCYPGRDANGADKPPCKECAPYWHPQFWPFLKNVRLTLLIGSYAQKYYLGKKLRPTLTETVKVWQTYGPEFIPLPHPSWRNTGWLKRHPWFEKEIIPVLQKKVRELLKNGI